MSESTLIRSRVGEDENGALLVVSHTFEEIGDEEALVRVISAREATAHERAQYESGQGR
jgi:uncharacterized DUF497 family protein